MMMILGMFVFSLPTLAYQELQRKTQWKYASNGRIGRRDAKQFTGPGDDTITLSGWVAPELTGSLYSFDALRLMADTGNDQYRRHSSKTDNHRLREQWVALHEGSEALSRRGRHLQGARIHRQNRGAELQL